MKGLMRFVVLHQIAGTIEAVEIVKSPHELDAKEISYDDKASIAEELGMEFDPESDDESIVIVRLASNDTLNPRTIERAGLPRGEEFSKEERREEWYRAREANGQVFRSRPSAS